MSVSPFNPPRAVQIQDAQWRRQQAIKGVNAALHELRIADAQLRRAQGMSA